jgi:hypothetical protein
MNKNNQSIKIDNYFSSISLFVVTIIFFYLIITLTVGCKKLVEVDPPIQEIVGQEIYKTNTNAASVLTGIYIDMSNYSIFTGLSSVSINAGLSADELVPITDPTNILSILYSNTLTNNGDLLFWTDMYAYIFRVNAAIEGISASSGITVPVKQQLIGEALFLRAFLYFYLVNFYGDVPLLLSTDVKINSIAARTEKAKVYEQIINDILDAKEKLREDYISSDITTATSDRARPNKAVATALLGRVYLYTQQWKLAEQEATKLISNTSVYKLETFNNVFLKSSKEAIWQLQPVNFSYNTIDAQIFVLSGIPAGPNSFRPVYLNQYLYNAFEPGDSRKKNWVDSVTVDGITYPYAYKYKVYLPGEARTEYLMVFRLGEQYLIRAEARAQQGNVTGSNSATADINTIRNRAGLPPTAATNQAAMLTAILQERQVELFTEWGHRWFDLQRMGKIDAIMNVVTPTKGGIWSPYKALYPIPVSNIQLNPSLKGHQNTGYPES